MSSRGEFVSQLFLPVDIASIAVFRIYFGLILLWSLWREYAHDLIATVYIDPQFHFTYHGFEWVRPWAGNGMYWHFAALAVFATFVTVGFLYRVSIALLWLGLTYVFLLEKAVYLNHGYLICLLAFLLIFVPANRTWSVDARLRPNIQSDSTPAWTLWLLRFQIAVPYVFGGIAKLNGDWLQGQPMQIWLSRSRWAELLGPFASETWVALAFSWGGLLFDLSIVPLLLWRRSRPFAFGVAVVFHLMNAFMFPDIGIFPWLMIGATALFLVPSWPRRAVGSRQSAVSGQQTAGVGRREKIAAALLAVYVVVQVLLPFRWWLYPGNVDWTEQGAMFSWRMMLRHKETGLRVLTIDSSTGNATGVNLRAWLNREQIEGLGRDPEMMREFANYLRARQAGHGETVEVKFITQCSLNGREPQPIVDAATDLSRQPRTLGSMAFVVPLEKQFQRPAWQRPADPGN